MKRLLGIGLAALSERRVAVGAISAAIVVLAILSLVRMPLQLLPEIRYPQIRIISDIPGQTSRVIEESVNEPIEAALQGIPGIVQLESRSGDGRSYLDLFFEPGYDLDRALRDVTQAVQRARPQIPPDYPEPRIFAVSTTEDPVLQFAFGSAELSAPEIRRRLRGSLLPRLRSIEGVEAVYMGREEVPELVVEVDPVRQRASGVRLEAIETSLMEATDPPPGSAMRTPSFEGIVVVGESGWDVDRLSSRPVPVTGSAIAVPLGSIATLHHAPSETRLRTRLDGDPAVLVEVHRSTRAHSLRVADQARSIVDELSDSEAFAGVSSTVLFDDAVVTRSAVRSVVTAAVGGALLAILLLSFTLRHRRHTPLVAMVVGVSLAATVVVLFGLGESLNLLTLAGLLLSVGLGLDYAIIYFDRLDRMGPGIRHPNVEAMVEVAGPLLGALLTTLAAVLPFLLVQGLVALLFRPLILTVVIAAIFSFLFALLILPAFSSAGGTEDGWEQSPSPRWWRRVQRPPVAWSAAAIAALILVLGARALPFEVLPVVDDGFVEARITHPAGIPPADLDQLARSAESALASIEGTQAVFTTVGGYFREGLPAFRPGQSDFMVRVAGRSSRLWADDARAALGGLGVPGLRIAVTPPRIRGVQTRLADADLIVVLSREDGDLLALGELEASIIGALEAVDGILDIQRVRAGVSPRWNAEPRHDLLAGHGIRLEDFNRHVAYALEGRVLRQRMANGEPLVLRTRYDRRVAGGPHQLDAVRIPSQSAGEVQLGDMADFALVEEPTHIERREGQRVARISAQLDPTGPGARVVERRVTAALQSAGLPSEVGWWLEGELDAIQETNRTFGISIAVALAMVLALLLVQYGSISFALAGLFSIPLSGAGAVILLAVLNRPLDAMVLAGLLIAVGIVANNVILVLSQAREASRNSETVSLSDALEGAARDRLRPITLTVFSTVLGMSPLVFGGAEVFGLLQPLAIALTGALLVSIPLACLILPGMVLGLSRLEDGLRRLHSRAGPGHSP